MSLTSRSGLFVLVAAFALVLSACGPSRSGGGPGPKVEGPPWQVVGTHDFAPEAEGNFVTALAVHGASLWVGTKTNLYQCSWDASARRLETQGHGNRIAAETGQVEVTRILPDGDRLWISTASGYARFEGGRWVKEDVGRISDLARFGNALWCATNSGVEILPDLSGEWKTVDIRSATDNSQTRSILSLCAQGGGVLWLGTKFGVHRFAPTNRNEPWKRYFGDFQAPSFGGFITNEKGNCDLAGNVIRRIAVNEAGDRVLFSTLGGLSVLDGEQRFRNYVGKHLKAKSGERGSQLVEVPGNTELPSNEIACAIALKDELWIGTKRGLVHVTKEETTGYDVTHGLPSNEIRDLAAMKGTDRLFVATAYGMAVLEKRR